ncbi:MAG: sulfite exporter TauE/SafE family protein [Acidimicrobiia bacterium]|nr:sulfite exporter TauE/SafE family protein [Acidimicrobiia bacterium]
MRRVIVVLVVGCIAQLIDGSLGMAYGVTSASLLLAVGVAPALASASVHFAEIGTTLASGISHWRFGNIDWRTVTRIAVPGGAGAFVGAVALSSISTALARPWVGSILLVLGVYILIRFSFGSLPQPKGRPYVRGRYLAALGAVAGFVDATGGGGWGPVATPTLLATGKMEPRHIIGSVDAAEFVVTVAASGGFLLSLGTGGIDWMIVGALMVGGLIAAPIAAWLVRKVVPRLLGAAVGGLIVLTNVRTLLNAFELEGSVRLVSYGIIVAFWVVAVATAVSKYRRQPVSAGPVERA